jgi:signal transduction histidine kinase
VTRQPSEHMVSSQGRPSRPAHAAPREGAGWPQPACWVVAGCAAAYAVSVHSLASPRGFAELIWVAGAVAMALLPPVAVFGLQRRHRSQAHWWRQQCQTANELIGHLQAENAELRGAAAKAVPAPGPDGGAALWARLLERMAAEWQTAHERVTSMLRQELPAAAGGGTPVPEPSSVEPVVFRNAGRRVHALALRALAALDRVEHRVEDPDQLHELFQIDHLVTQTLRQAERLAVLGGQTSRQVREPLLMPTVLRQAVAEIEHYRRVEVTLPDIDVDAGADAAVPGYAGPDVIHLLAELVENATEFSPPETQVLMRTAPVPQGRMIEITDCGLSMSPPRLDALNRLLASPRAADEGARLEEGQIGLVVAARLAGRHGIRIVLRARDGGGTLAQVVLPNSLLVNVGPAQPSVPTRPREAIPQPTAPYSPTMNSAAPTAAPVPGSRHVAPGDVPPLPRRRPPAAPARAPEFREPSPSRQGTGPQHVPPNPAPGGMPDRAPNGTDGAERPVLPRRSATTTPHDTGPLPPAHRSPASGPASPGLMASFTEGVRDAQAGRSGRSEQSGREHPDDHHETRS